MGGSLGQGGISHTGPHTSTGQEADALQAQGEALSSRALAPNVCKGRSLQLALDEEAKPRGLKNAPEGFRTVCPLQCSALPGRHWVWSISVPSRLASCSPCKDVTRAGYGSPCSHIWGR